MTLKERLRALILTKSESVAEVNPWAEESHPASDPINVNPWKPSKPKSVKSPVGEEWKSVRPQVKVRVLHLLSSVMILLNVVVGLFFYSNNMTLNAALLGYLGVSTILLGHYFALTRG